MLKKNKKEINIFKGTLKEKDRIAPSYINNKNPKAAYPKR